MSHAAEDSDEGLVIHDAPPDPMLVAGMAPADEVSYRMQITAVDVGETGTPGYEGHLDMVHRYPGAYRVTVPAGTFEAAVFRWRFVGKVGPASIDDLQFGSYAEGVGPVAIVERKDISAFVVYRTQNRDARVLARRP